MLTFPKDSARLKWTRHIKNKMVYYHLSGAQILRIFRRPDRVEEAIAPGTVGAMKSTKKKTEIWIMYKVAKSKGQMAKIVMISAWIYPGKTKPGAPIPIPQDILTELTEAGTLEA